jgi:hypothetical protein
LDGNSKNEGVKEYLYKTKNHLKCCRESKYFLARWQAETDRGRVTKLEDTQKSWEKKNRERKKKRGIIYRRMCFHIGKIDTFCCNIDAAFVFLMNHLMPLCFVNIGSKKRRRRKKTIQNTPISRFVNWKKPLMAETPTSYTLMSLLRKPNLTTY